MSRKALCAGAETRLGDCSYKARPVREDPHCFVDAFMIAASRRLAVSDRLSSSKSGLQQEQQY